MTVILSNPEKSRAVLVGVHRYKHRSHLPAVRHNVRDLRDTLPNSKIWGLPLGNCVVIEQPSDARSVLEPLRWAAEKATDTLVFYYAGHGLPEIGGLSSLLLTLPHSDSDPWNAVHFEWVRRIITDSSAERKLVILDCCYSGRAIGAPMGESSELEARASIPGTCVLAAAATGIALSPEGQRHTAFTGELLDIMSSGQPRARQFLDMATIYRHLRQRMSSRGLPLPSMGTDDDGSGIAIARNVAFTPTGDGPSISFEHSPSAATGRNVRRIASVFTLILLVLMSSGAPATLKNYLLRTNADALRFHRATFSIDIGYIEPTTRSFKIISRNGTAFFASLTTSNQLQVVALSAATGELLWRANALDVPVEPSAFLTMALSLTATVLAVAVDDAKSATVVYYDIASGNFLWRYHGAAQPRFSAGADYLVVMSERYGRTPRAQIINARTGETLWQAASPSIYPIMNSEAHHAGSQDPYAARAPDADVDALDLRVVEVGPMMRTRSSIDGSVRTSTKVPAPFAGACNATTGECNAAISVQVMGDLMIISKHPQGPAGIATVSAFDISTGSLQWSRTTPHGEFSPDGNVAIPCTTRHVCIQRLANQGYQFQVVELATGTQVGNLDGGRESGFPVSYYPLFFDHKRAVLVRQDTNFGLGSYVTNVLVVDPTSGLLLLRENGVAPMMSGTDTLVLLRGQMDGPTLGKVFVSAVDLKSGAARSLGTLKTAASLCGVTEDVISCVGEDGMLHGFGLRL